MVRNRVRQLEQLLQRCDSNPNFCPKGLQFVTRRGADSAAIKPEGCRGALAVGVVRPTLRDRDYLEALSPQVPSPDGRAP
jgi:hypothetical protein